MVQHLHLAPPGEHGHPGLLGHGHLPGEDHPVAVVPLEGPLVPAHLVEDPLEGEEEEEEEEEEVQASGPAPPGDKHTFPTEPARRGELAPGGGAVAGGLPGCRWLPVVRSVLEHHEAGARQLAGQEGALGS